MKTSINIIILEDNLSDQHFLLRELKKSTIKFKYTITDSKETFENALNELEPDLILADYALPTFDGFAAFKMARDRNINVPFILVSGSIGEEKAVDLIKCGITDYVLKDRLITLNPKIMRALNDHKSEQAKKEAEEKVKLQNSKLIEVAYFQSHIVRTPICQILGLFNLIDFNNFSNPENATLIKSLKDVADTIDNIIRRIVNITNDIETMTHIENTNAY